MKKENMKENGFTLVELLAVIAIMAILVVILVPNVVKMFNGAKQDTFVTQVQTLMQQAQEKWILDGGGTKIYLHCMNADPTTSSLDIQGNDMTYRIVFGSDGNITSVNATDGTFSIIAPVDGATSVKAAELSSDDTNTFGTKVSDVNTTVGCN